MKRDKIAIFMGGLPGSGKTTYIEQNPEQFLSCQVIAADTLRKQLPGYDGSPEFDAANHERSVELAEEAMYKAFSEENSVVMDAGSINNSYTSRIMKAAKKAGYYVKLIYIDTPAHICIERISHRERKVPIDSIIWKSQRAKSKIANLRGIVDSYEQIPYYTDKYHFFDMDGTLAAYENFETNEQGEVDFFNANNFEFADPIGPSIQQIKYLVDMRGYAWDTMYIFSASPNSIATEGKRKWLAKYLPELPIENQIFVGNKDYKHLSFAQLLKRLKISKKEATYVEDDHAVIRKCLKKGINCIHISKFLA